MTAGKTAIVSMARVVLLSLLYPTGFQAKIQNSIKSLLLINTQGVNRFKSSIHMKMLPSDKDIKYFIGHVTSMG